MAKQFKCWRKIKDRENSVIFLKKEKGEFGVRDQVFVEKVFDNPWMVNATNKSKVVGIAYPINSKSQALKIAESYMRKHDKCRVRK